MWGYCGSYGVVTEPNGKATLDKATVKALGLPQREVISPHFEHRKK